jgi:titin
MGYSTAEAQLDTPSSLQATSVSSGQINISWIDNNAKPAEDGFEIQRAVSSSGPWSLIATTGTNATSYTNSGLNASTTYYYRVRAFKTKKKGTERSSFSNTANATTQSGATAPNAPSGLSATSVSTSQINLSWNDNSNNESGFKVERATSSGGPFSQIATRGANSTSYSNAGLSSSTTYYYRVRAYNSAGNSGYNSSWSNIPSVTTPSGGSVPAAPSGLSATSVSTSQINLSWNDNSNNESGFKVERATSSGGPFSQIATRGANSTSYSNTGLSSSTTYYYRVRAYNSSGNSGYSNTGSATTQSGGSVPNAPTNLTATAVSSSQINLTWQDNAGNENGFHVWRYHSSVGWSQIDIVGANTTNYPDSGLSPATSYSYAVRAYNAAGVSGWSNVPTATTLSAGGDTEPPSVSITSPPSGSTYTSAQTVPINVSASDNVGVTMVRFYDNGSLKYTDTTAPYSYNWPVTSSQNGIHNCTARAYDAAGYSTTSSAVSLTVNIPVPDTTPPTVSITSPSNGSTYTSAQTVPINASASDNVGVTMVRFYDNGSFKFCCFIKRQYPCS